MWVCLLLLDSIWDSLPEWFLFYKFLIFSVWYHILLSHRLILRILVCICGVWTLLCQFLHAFPIPVTCVPIHCTLIFSIMFHPFLLGLCTPKTFLQSHSGCFSVGSTVIVYFFRVCVDIVFWSSVKFFIGSIGNTVGAFLNVVASWIIWVLDRVL